MANKIAACLMTGGIVISGGSQPGTPMGPPKMVTDCDECGKKGVMCVRVDGGKTWKYLCGTCNLARLRKGRPRKK